MNQYLLTARHFAREAGYSPSRLRLATDGRHKFNYMGIAFGNVDYPDYIQFLMANQVGEAINHRDNYLSRSANIRGNWRQNPLSKNNLARRIIWAALD